MENNKEIRQRMETYRIILLILNWICAFALLILGIVLANSQFTQSIGIGLIIGSVILGIIGHFFTNVGLAIPFILLNNGDILESLKLNSSGDDNSEKEVLTGQYRKNLALAFQKPKGIDKEKIGIATDGTKWNCPNCGSENPNNSYKCKSCGYSIV